MKSLIVIPARYQSTRLPGKPLVHISGQTMLQRVINIARAASEGLSQVSIIVATDDERIVHHCDKLNVDSLLTPAELASGTDRVAFTVEQLKTAPDFVLNMQGDAPLTPPDFIRSMIQSYQENPCDAVTPVAQLTWKELDVLRKNKEETPFSGTTVTFNHATGMAFWFSKQIIPAIRNESQLKEVSKLSPVYRHIGLYGYSYDVLKQFKTLNEGFFEKLEGLEQLRLLEHGYQIRCVPVDFGGRANMSGVDSPQDVARAEALISKHGELL